MTHEWIDPSITQDLVRHLAFAFFDDLHASASSYRGIQLEPDGRARL